VAEDGHRAGLVVPLGVVVALGAVVAPVGVVHSILVSDRPARRRVHPDGNLPAGAVEAEVPDETDRRGVAALGEDGVLHAAGAGDGEAVPLRDAAALDRGDRGGEVVAGRGGAAPPDGRRRAGVVVHGTGGERER